MITNVDALTVFNGRLDRETRRKIYMPTVIHNVSYVESKGSTVTNNGVWSSNVQYKIRIPITAKVQDNRTYIPCLEYGKMDNDGAVKHWTISKEDWIIHGEYDGEKQQFFEDELTSYAKEHGADLIRISEYADDTFGGSFYTRHWRIGGK